jgi:hypothetical protein
MGRTDGIGALHALGKGISGLRTRGKDKAIWLVNGKLPVDADGDPVVFPEPGIHGSVKCDICLELTAEPIPVAITAIPVGEKAEPRMAESSTGIDKIVCIGCFLSWDEEIA